MSVTNLKKKADTLHLQISMTIWHWHLPLSSQRIIYTHIKIIIKVTCYRTQFHFISPSLFHTHTHTHKFWSSPLLGFKCPGASTEDQIIKKKQHLQWHDCVCRWVWVCLHHGSTVTKLVAKPEPSCPHENNL